MDKIQDCFLQLLRWGLWKTPVRVEDFVGMNATEWALLCKIAYQQACGGIVGDAILSLPKEVLPPKAVVARLMTLLYHLKQQNEIIEGRLKEISQAYTEAGLSFLLLKGSGMAQNYPQPHLRAPGDIDLYLYKEGDYDRANEWAVTHGYKIEYKVLYEACYHYKEVSIENHLFLTYFGRKKYDKALQQILTPIIEKRTFQKLNIAGAEIAVLPHTLNAVYLFQHILHHFSYLGIGLRQYSDWLLFLHRYKEEIDKEQFLYYAKKLDLLRPMQHFAEVAIRYLGAPTDIFPFTLTGDSRYALVILKDCLKQGNFGFNEFQGKTFSSNFTRQCFFYRRMIKRMWRIGGISPEHIVSKSWVSILNQVKKLFIK